MLYIPEYMNTCVFNIKEVIDLKNLLLLCDSASRNADSDSYVFPKQTEKHWAKQADVYKLHSQLGLDS